MRAAESTPVAREISERAFQAVVVEYAQRLGYLVFHDYDSRRSTPGFPDLVMVKEGRLVVAELKRETGRTKPEQAEWLRLLRSAGVEAYIWRPSTWPEIESVLG